jgi:hypothetical protein
MVAPPGLEPGSSGPEPLMLDRYTTGLQTGIELCTLITFSVSGRSYIHIIN